MGRTKPTKKSGGNFHTSCERAARSSSINQILLYGLEIRWVDLLDQCRHRLCRETLAVHARPMAHKVICNHIDDIPERRE